MLRSSLHQNEAPADRGFGLGKRHSLSGIQLSPTVEEQSAEDSRTKEADRSWLGDYVAAAIAAGAAAAGDIGLGERRAVLERDVGDRGRVLMDQNQSVYPTAGRLRCFWINGSPPVALERYP